MLYLWFPLVAGLFILLGSLIVFFSKNSQKFVQFSIGMAFGVMTMLIIFELLPESIELMNESLKQPISYIALGSFILLGMGILKALDLFIPDHNHDCHDEHDHNNNLLHIGVVSSIALILHNIIEGMAIYSTAKTSLEMGIMITLGVGFHNVPMGMVITSTLEKTKTGKRKWMMLAIALSTVFGGLLMIFMEKWMTDFVISLLISLTLGMLLYIMIFELLKEMLHERKHKQNIFGIVVGICIFLCSFFLE